MSAADTDPQSRTILKLERVSKRFGATVTAKDLSLSVERGEFFTFLGPSGSGKSTILRMVAGLESPDSGRILIDGRDMTMVAPWHRNLGMMFQQYAVFPHMTVAQNVGYGLKVRRMTDDQRRNRVVSMLDLVGLGRMRDKNVTLLSGGEQQRVALARALAPEPRMILLDEPLSALDETIRRSMQAELKSIHHKTGTTFLYVTHDQEEALTMSDRIAVFNLGECVQCDAPDRLYKRPKTQFVAGFFRGCNVLSVQSLRSSDNRWAITIAGVVVPDVLRVGDAETPNHVALRAENITLEPAEQSGGCRISATILDTIYRGTLIDYEMRLSDGQRLVASVTRKIDRAPGDPITIGFSSADVVTLAD